MRGPRPIAKARLPTGDQRAWHALDTIPYASARFEIVRPDGDEAKALYAPLIPLS
jgi:hypothetical protein